MPESRPVLRAHSEGGQTWDDPSADLLYELLGDLARGEEEFFVVERLQDQTGQTYIQVMLLPDGDWLVEHRDGGPDRHFKTTLADRRAVHTLITSWAFDGDGWRDTASWSEVDLASASEGRL